MVWPGRLGAGLPNSGRNETTSVSERDPQTTTAVVMCAAVGGWGVGRCDVLLFPVPGLAWPGPAAVNVELACLLSVRLSVSLCT
jgi:hypothetical protein